MANFLGIFFLFVSTAFSTDCTTLIRLVDSPGLTDYEHARASDLFTVRWENRHFERAIDEAHSQFPTDPRARGLFLSDRLGENGGNRIVPLDNEGRPAFLGNLYHRAVSVEFSRELNTGIFRSKQWSAEEADVILLALHGMGGGPSHSRSWFMPGQVLSRVSVLGLKSPKNSAVQLRRRFPNGFKFPKIHLIAIDQPGHGTGPRADRYLSMDQFIEWLESAIRALHVPGKPIVIISRSASSPIVRETIARWESNGTAALIDAAIEVGPVFPGPEERKHDLDGFIEEAMTARKAVDREVNWPGWMLSRNLLLQTTWLSSPPTTLPILTIVGKGDSVVSLPARAKFKELSGLNPRNRYVEVPGGHDPFFIIKHDRRNDVDYSLDGYEAVLRFLDGVLRP